MPDRSRAELLAILAAQEPHDYRARDLPFPAVVMNARCPGCGVVWDYDEDGDGYGVWTVDGVLWCSAECWVNRYRTLNRAVKEAIKAFITRSPEVPADAAIGSMRNAIMNAAFPTGKVTGDGGPAQ
jgi:hypothetical protein